MCVCSRCEKGEPTSSEFEAARELKTEPVCVAASVFLFGVMFTHVLDSDCQVFRQ